METEQKQPESLNAEVSQGTIALSSAGQSNLPQLPPATATTPEWQQITNQVTDFLAELPEYLGSFYQQYSRSILTVLLILAAIVTLKVVLALLGAINGIPLLAPFFELIGLSYSTWFTFRYLIKSSTRQELTAEIRTLKSQVFGE
ncbi:CAAD domain-containing protein [Nostoc parmelioides]|uniref:CAAD domain-containing protein n=1 Tax=Nostoc parmelioides FACHB-3921 TaxID=2692909 RepID=A0ABR8B849_9NOSO|nr:CAAD domain-containing protein [Nostoc parmelioides]MBD2250288.1 CAAD domain-containing protein [Nostoc parmelioides FACHB-3921]